MSQEKKKLNTDSNAYTIVYAAVMVVIVALLLALTSSALKKRQDDNIALDKKKQILRALNVNLDGQDAAALYEQYVTAAQLVKIDGTVVSEDRDVAFGVDVAKENAKPETERQLPIYFATIDGQQKYVLPLRGAGLWGPIWGYVALNDDKQTIFGVDFSHESETPGLGGEITKEFFTTRFKGKTLYASGENAVEVVKSNANDQQVDAISGATFTSNGVRDMFNSSLKQYVIFLGGISEGSTVEANDTADSTEGAIDSEATQVMPCCNAATAEIAEEASND
ncbi:MAG: NADH:ubiquinone reductase (Na(+)-transporting) subunit C [Paludibacteraceae bacterium]|nr:NADH:ubiquinone reductase (Na(+)-transporting) subunit C [Paludibacteraceae bacterium]